MNILTPYIRICPGCGGTQTYDNKSNLLRAIKSDTVCHSCRMKGRVYTDEIRKHMSDAAKKRSSPMKGRHHSDETKRRIGENQPEKSGKNSIFFGTHPTDQTRQKLSMSHLGKKRSAEVKTQISISQKKRYSDKTERQKLSELVTAAMHRPDVRKRHIEALHHSKWIKVRTDKGQIELLEKWNRLGFQFQPNYQIKTDIDLFYIDGYDPIHNVIFEYDGKYHHKMCQRKKDLDRQQKIIDLLNPKKFWRYDSTTHTLKDVIGG